MAAFGVRGEGAWRGMAAAALDLALAGCAGAAPGGSVVDGRADVDTRMRAVAGRFDGAFRDGGMTGVMLDVQACYAAATRPVARVFALRDCLVYDNAANDFEERVGVRVNGAKMPFWATEAATARWRRYGPQAGFDSAPRFVGYMRDSSELVRERLAAMRSPLAGMDAVATAPAAGRARGAPAGGTAAASGASAPPGWRPPVPAQPIIQVR